MATKEASAGARQRRFAAYLESLARAAQHADRSEPLKNYCRGLLLPLKCKSVEPMAARLAAKTICLFRTSESTAAHQLAKGRSLFMRGRGGFFPTHAPQECPFLAF